MSATGPVHLHGLTVASPVQMAAAPAPVGRDPDLRLELSGGALPPIAGDVVADCREPGPGYLLLRDGDDWALTFPELLTARWRADAVPVDVRVESVSDGLLPVLLGGPLMAAIALSRGHELLHASAVAWPGGVVALLGPPGAGKSSIARLLVGDDRALMTDDALRVDLGPAGPDLAVGPVLAHRGTTASRLRTEVAVGDEVTGRSADGRVTIGPEPGAPDSAPLLAVLRPLLSPVFAAPRLRPAAPTSAITELATSWPLTGLSDPGVLAARLGWATRLVARVPVIGLEVPWTGTVTPADREALLAVVGDLLHDRSTEPEGGP